MSGCRYKFVRISKTLVMIFFCLLSNTKATSMGEENAISSGCGEVGDCIAGQDCDNKCGCDSSAAVLFYNETLDACVVDVKKLLQSLQERYNIQEKLRMEVVRVFQGVTVSVILFMTCVGVCVCTSCIYCIRINYIDNRMKNDIEALAAKLKRECRLKKSLKSPSSDQKAESCNIIVEEAGVFVV
ncbi:uncharacterized protein LOC120625210 [Pararge aegeria]|uniref:Jg7396 protein n=1 Tax=Pararge aegeria aegeria TaxID=348720 RepID=A0A8S4RQP4_9NEOP|nr:uncharacterized protein LOC120625210 [Pararge aegeria]CAH2240053.1 jg7396 [Pararge aegeria aegeria]